MNTEPQKIERKYQVFISSTYKDLADYRKEALNAIIDRQHMPIALERYSSQEGPVPNVIKRAIAQSQIYIVIVGHRYGATYQEKDKAGNSIGPIKSFTQIEYEHAMTITDLKVLTFVMDDHDVGDLRAELHKSQAQEDIADIDNERLFQDFRKTIKNPDHHFCCIFRKGEIKDFKSEVLKSLFEVEQSKELRGWVREPEEDKLRNAFSSVSRNQYIVDIVDALSELETLDERVGKEPKQK